MPKGNEPFEAAILSAAKNDIVKSIPGRAMDLSPKKTKGGVTLDNRNGSSSTLAVGEHSGYALLLAGDAGDTLLLGNWNGVARGGKGNDRIIGGTSGDIMRGNDGDDIIFSGFHTDKETYKILDGGNGDDILINQDGANAKFTGGLGNDIFVIEAGNGGSTTITDFNRNKDGTGDKIYITGLSDDQLASIKDAKGALKAAGIDGNLSRATEIEKTTVNVPIPQGGTQQVSAIVVR